MRFMLMVKGNKVTETGAPPDAALLEAMGKFNEEMIKAGVMLDGAGLQPTSKGATVKFAAGKRTIVDGPFAETKEIIAGYWLIQVKSREEAIEWAKRSPNPMGPDAEAEIEIRQLFETADFEMSPEQRKAFDEMTAKMQAKS